MNQEIYALEDTLIEGHSVFLAGPTPRDKNTNSWRPDMISALRRLGYDGDILIPEKRGDYLSYEYETNTKWEVDHLNAAKIILFWIPRQLASMPAFTTNIEFGEFMHSGKVVLSFPKEAEKMQYLAVRAKMHNIPTFHTIDEAAVHVVEKADSYITRYNIKKALNDAGFNIL